MRKQFTIIVSLFLLPLAVQAKIPEQGAVFVLTRVSDKGEKKVAADEVLPAGSHLRLRVEARMLPCTVVAAAFQRGKAREIASLPPSLFQLSPDDQGSSEFKLDKPLKASEFFVVVAPQHSPSADQLSDLVSKWRKQPKDSQGPRTALHDQLSHWLALRDKSLNYSGTVPKELGGVRISSAQPVNPTAGAPQRESAKSNGAVARDFQVGESREWQKNADWLPCSGDKPGVFVYRLGK